MNRFFLITLFFISILVSVDNYNLLSKKNLYSLESNRNYERGTFLIILANPGFYDRLSYNALGYDFINFKKTQGYDVEVFSYREGSDDIVGINAQNETELKDFLINYYNQNPMLEYVLLIGDVNQSSEDYNIPTFTIPSYNPPIVDDQTDYPYTFWGNDTGQNGQDAYSPKFFIGRWSIRTEDELEKIKRRSIGYVTMTFPSADQVTTLDPSYLN